MDFSLQHAVEVAQDKLSIWKEELIQILPNFVVALGVMILFILIAKLAKAVTRKVSKRFTDKSALSNLIASIVYIFVLVGGLILALNIMHLQQTVTSLLAGAGIIGLALGFAFQDISANFISGVFMAIRKPIRVGDIIEFNNFLGKVEEINLRSTMLRTFQGLHVIVPNKDIFQNPVTNFTLTNTRRIDLEIGVAYKEDLETVKKIALRAIKKQPFVLKDEPIDIFFNEFGSSSINFTAMFWITYPDQPGYLKARSEAIIAIKKAFDDENITIPFPQRTLNFGTTSSVFEESMQGMLNKQPENQLN